MALTSSQINEIRAAHDTALSAKDPSIYYSALAKYAFYGELALGVVRDDTFSGIVANNYAQNKIEHDLGGAFDARRSALMMELMEQDFGAREAAVWNDIGGKTISDYHDAAFRNVFTSLSRSPEAWTPYYAVRALNDYDAWLPLFSATSAFVNAALVGRMGAELFYGSSSSSQLSYNWFQDLWPRVFNPQTYGFDDGDNVLGHSFVEWAGKSAPGLLQFFNADQPDAQSATDIAGFYGMGYRELQLDLIERNAYAGAVTLSGSGHTVDVGAAGASGWLDTVMTGVKLSVAGGLSAANFRLVSAPDERFAETFGKIEAYGAAKILLATDSTAGAPDGGGAVLAVAGNSNITDSDGDDLIVGNAGADEITSGKGDDLLFGGAGADKIESKEGKDTIDGGVGNDYLLVGNAEDKKPNPDCTIIVRDGSGHDVLEYVIDYSHTGRSLEAVRFEGIDKSELSLVWEFETLSSGSSNYRRGDAAIVYGDSSIFVKDLVSNEEFYSGNWNPAPFKLICDDGVVEDWTEIFGPPNSATRQVVPQSWRSAADDHDSARSINGTGGDDSLSGSSGSDNIFGGAGADRLSGLRGDDMLNGGSGADAMSGGAGDDLYYADSSGDAVSETAGQGVDTVRSSVTHTLSANVENLTLIGPDAVDGSGNGLDNVLLGNGAANKLYGLGGADDMRAGLGNDRYYVTDAGDTVTEASNAGIDIVESTVSYRLSLNVENLKLAGSGSISGTGTAGVNTIAGNGAANVLNGAAGADTLTGGLGQDSFVFSTALEGGNVDRVVDFNVADDTIRLDDIVFAGLSPGTLAVKAFAIAAAAADADDRIIYDAATGALWFDRDGSAGAYAAIQFATLSQNLSLTNADFLVV